MRVLIGCECSGVLRDAFAARGHDAWSCDTKPTERPGKHLLGNVLDYLYWRWDLAIFFPPCTDLCVSGARWFVKKRADGSQRRSIEFFMALANAHIPSQRNLGIPKFAIENPIGIMSRLYRKPDQIIQPYEFGDDASKRTCLWLHGLPKLIKDPALRLPGRLVVRNGQPLERWSNQTDSGQNRLGPSEQRAGIRARTYAGIANAMAAQWTTL